MTEPQFSLEIYGIQGPNVHCEPVMHASTACKSLLHGKEMGTEAVCKSVVSPLTWFGAKCLEYPGEQMYILAS